MQFPTPNLTTIEEDEGTAFQLGQNFGGLGGFEFTGFEDTFTHEPETDPLIRRHHLRWFYFLSLIVALEYTAITPSIFAYISAFEGECEGKKKSFCNLMMGASLASYNLASFVAGPFFTIGALKINYRVTIFLCLLTMVLGNLVYSFAAHVSMIPIGRFVAGVGAALVGPSLTYLRTVTTSSERTPKVILFRLYSNFGVLLGPAVSLIITSIGHAVHKEPIPYGRMFLSSSAVVGYFNAIICLACAIASLFIIHEPTILYKDDSASKVRAHISIPMFTILAINFCVSFILIAFQTIIPSLSATNFNWGPVIDSLFFLGISALSIPAVVIAKIIGKISNERIVIILGLITLSIGLAFDLALSGKEDATSTKLQLAAFIVGAIPFTIGVAFVNVMSPSVYSQLIPPWEKSAAMSFLPAAANMARIVGPFFGSGVFGYAHGKGELIGVGSLMGVGIICAIGTIIMYKTLAPGKFDSSRTPLVANEMLTDDDSKKTELYTDSL